MEVQRRSQLLVFVSDTVWAPPPSSVLMLMLVLMHCRGSHEATGAGPLMHASHQEDLQDL